MRWPGLLLAGLLPAHAAWAHDPDPPTPVLSVRLSVLLAPLTPLLTVETRTVGRLTLQAETNFQRIHGLNARYYLRQRMQRGYLFVGSAWVGDPQLRADNRPTVLPYAGYGYTWALSTRWTADARAGLGPTLNADTRRVYPVVKVGAGRRF